MQEALTIQGHNTSTLDPHVINLTTQRLNSLDTLAGNADQGNSDLTSKATTSKATSASSSTAASLPPPHAGPNAQGRKLDGRLVPTVMLLGDNLLTASSLEAALWSKAMVWHGVRKLDVSGNRLERLPAASFWAQLPSLQVLNLESNRIAGGVNDVEVLFGLHKLEILFLHGNPIAEEPLYRHLLVNGCPSLKLLDLQIVSDEELIEGADFGARFGSTNPELAVRLYRNAQAQPTEQLRLLEWEVAQVRKLRNQFSAVVAIQRRFRGYLVRKTLRRLHAAATVVQTAFRRFKIRAAGVPRLPGEHSLAEESPLWKRALPTSAASSTSLHFVVVSRTAMLIFAKLIKRVERHTNRLGSRLVESPIRLLSEPSLTTTNTIPLAQRHPTRPGRASLVLPHTFMARHRRALRYIKRRGVASCRADRELRKLDEYRETHPDGGRRGWKLLHFESPGMEFHAELIRSVEEFNIAQGFYGQPDVAQPAAGATRHIDCRLVLFPSHALALSAAALTIQSAWRAHHARQGVVPPLGDRLLEQRATVALVRWWKMRMLHHRLYFLTGLSRYLATIDSSNLVVRADAVTRVKAGLPELRVFPEQDVHVSMDGRSGMVVLDDASTSRLRPLPRWLLNRAGVGERLMIKGDAGSPKASVLQLLSIGAQTSWLHSATLGKDEEETSKYLRCAFHTVEDARLRAALVLLATWDPARVERSALPLLSAKHIMLAGAPRDPELERAEVLRYFWAGGAGGGQGEQFVFERAMVEEEVAEVRDVGEAGGDEEVAVEADGLEALLATQRVDVVMASPRVHTLERKLQLAESERKLQRQLAAQKSIQRYEELQRLRHGTTMQRTQHEQTMAVVRAQQTRDTTEAREMSRAALERLRRKKEAEVMAKKHRVVKDKLRRREAKARAELKRRKAERKRQQLLQEEREYRLRRAQEAAEARERTVRQQQEQTRQRISKQARLRTFRQETAAFARQQNMMAKHVLEAKKQRERHKAQQARARRVAELKAQRKQRRHEIEQALMEAYDARRQAAVQQHYETHEALTRRREEESRRVRLLRDVVGGDVGSGLMPRPPVQVPTVGSARLRRVRLANVDLAEFGVPDSDEEADEQDREMRRQMHMLRELAQQVREEFAGAVREARGAESEG